MRGKQGAQQQKIDLDLEREFTRPIEIRLREEIRRRELNTQELADLLSISPTRTALILSRVVGFWSLKECLHVARALGLRATFVLSSVETTSSRLMAE